MALGEKESRSVFGDRENRRVGKAGHREERDTECGELESL